MDESLRLSCTVIAAVSTSLRRLYPFNCRIVEETIMERRACVTAELAFP